MGLGRPRAEARTVLDHRLELSPNRPPPNLAHAAALWETPGRARGRTRSAERALSHLASSQSTCGSAPPARTSGRRAEEEAAVDQELHHELRPRSVDHHRREARRLLRGVRERQRDAVRRARDALGTRMDERFVLADALHVIALEHGFRSWPAFKHAAEAQAAGA